mmetsp:Transcript_7806/g.24082  ORF Transcript_7806/g.24082 Transcript_7806/m.24082 type:complete len:309 (+) Transcript_7806:192-1118(+)
MSMQVGQWNCQLEEFEESEKLAVHVTRVEWRAPNLIQMTMFQHTAVDKVWLAREESGEYVREPLTVQEDDITQFGDTRKEEDHAEVVEKVGGRSNAFTVDANGGENVAKVIQSNGGQHGGGAHGVDLALHQQELARNEILQEGLRHDGRCDRGLGAQEVLARRQRGGHTESDPGHHPRILLLDLSPVLLDVGRCAHLHVEMSAQQSDRCIGGSIQDALEPVSDTSLTEGSRQVKYHHIDCSTRKEELMSDIIHLLAGKVPDIHQNVVVFVGAGFGEKRCDRTATSCGTHTTTSVQSEGISTGWTLFHH